MNRDRDEQYRKEFRPILAETGHKTLNALLIVSGGAVIAFLTFLGAAFQHREIAARIAPQAIQGFIQAMQFFVWSVLIGVLAHGITYLSHGAYHLRWERIGNVLAAFAIVLGILWLCAFAGGSLVAISAFRLAAGALPISP